MIIFTRLNGYLRGGSVNRLKFLFAFVVDYTSILFDCAIGGVQKVSLTLHSLHKRTSILSVVFGDKEADPLTPSSSPLSPRSSYGRGLRKAK